jgi:hypothetical protein
LGVLVVVVSRTTPHAPTDSRAGVLIGSAVAASVDTGADEREDERKG